MVGTKPLPIHAGKGGHFIDASILPQCWKIPKKSTVAEKIGYAQIPAGPTGIRKTNLWYWSLAISSLSKHKAAAAQFIAWASSKDICLKVAAASGGSARGSVWEPRIIPKVRQSAERMV